MDRRLALRASNPLERASGTMATDFYRALADMRKVTLQATDAQGLYEEVCRIAVASGHALMAWVGLLQDDLVVPVAWAGPAYDYTKGLTISLARAEGAEEVFGPTAYAVAYGQPCVCNDFSVNERTQPWREQAARFDVGASVAYPIRRGDRTVGALNIYFRAPGSCDAALMELVDLMASDLSYALEHIDEQAARAEAEAAAEEHEMRLANIIDVALEAIIIVDAGFRVVVFNRSASQMFGVAASDALGQGLDRFIPERHREAHRHHVAAFGASGNTSRHMGDIRRVEALRSDGTIFPIEASISRVAEGERALSTVMIRDVTKLREAEHAQMARITAEAANRAKTKFLSRISHELRTPLNAMLGFAQLMQVDRAEPPTARQTERIAHILHAGQHLCSLIDETLDVARIELGQMRIEPVELDLVSLLDSVLRMSAPQAAKAGIQVEAAYRSLAGMDMHADPARLMQVLLNLLSNAIKYNKRDGWVRVEVIQGEAWVQITVRDGGLGMTSIQLASLFDPFNRLGREASDVQGSGLGLVLVKQMVELMEGQLEIHSESGIGTSVSITLPRRSSAQLP